MKERLLSLFGGPIVYYIWLWRFLVVFHTPLSARIWRIESVSLYDRSLERHIKTFYERQGS